MSDIIVPAAAVTFASTIAASALPTKFGGQGKTPSPRLLIGTGLTFTGLSFLYDLAPSIVTPLAASIAITALTYYGIPVLDAYFNGKHNGPSDAAVRANPTIQANLATIISDPNAYLIR